MIFFGERFFALPVPAFFPGRRRKWRIRVAQERSRLADQGSHYGKINRMRNSGTIPNFVSTESVDRGIISYPVMPVISSEENGPGTRRKFPRLHQPICHRARSGGSRHRRVWQSPAGRPIRPDPNFKFPRRNSWLGLVTRTTPNGMEFDTVDGGFRTKLFSGVKFTLFSICHY